MTAAAVDVEILDVVDAAIQGEQDVAERICKCCYKIRHTTNKEEPYVCELCLRKKGRSLLLEKMAERKSFKIVKLTKRWSLFIKRKI